MGGPAALPCLLLPHLAPPTLLCPPCPTHPADLSSLWESVFASSRPLPATNQGGSLTTLGQALHAVLPLLFPAITPGGGAQAAPASVPLLAPAGPEGPGAQAAQELQSRVSHGISHVP